VRVPWTARRSKQSILKENLMERTDSLEKTLMKAGGEGDDRG